mgnify:CR=1 FL=1
MEVDSEEHLRLRASQVSECEEVRCLILGRAWALLSSEEEESSLKQEPSKPTNVVNKRALLRAETPPSKNVSMMTMTGEKGEMSQMQKESFLGVQKWLIMEKLIPRISISIKKLAFLG